MCKAGFFMNYVNARYSGSLLEFERRVCDSCPAVGGYDCSLPGNALETLRIRPGYSRSYNLSTTVFQCVRKKFCTGTNAISGTFDAALGGQDEGIGAQLAQRAGVIGRAASSDIEIAQENSKAVFAVRVSRNDDCENSEHRPDHFAD